MPKLLEIYREAETELLQGRYEPALVRLAQVIRTDPAHLWSRFLAARALEGMKEFQRAFDIYKAVAEHCLRAGYPLLGLDATKRAGRLQTGFESTLRLLADMYGLESDRIESEMELPSPPELRGDLEVTAPAPPSDKLVSTVSGLARSFENARYPKTVPAAPFFSLLSAEAIYPILEIMELRSYSAGEPIVREGDPGTSVYMLAFGEVEARESRGGETRVLARFSSNSVFGEMALITDAPRVASAVALRESDVLELRREDLEAAAADIDDLTLALARFVRQRFLHFLLATNPVFAPFSREKKRALLEMFTSIGIPTDEVIIREGTPGPGLYMILGGEVEVTKFEGSSRIHLATLREGSVFGEISLIQDTPTTATVRAVRGGEFLFLSRADFLQLAREEPKILEALKALSAERIEEQRKVMQKAAAPAPEATILF